MAKNKARNNKPASVSNRPIYSRISYLYQAASHLSAGAHEQLLAASVAKNADKDEPQPGDEGSQVSRAKARQTMSRLMVADIRAISQKAQIRLSPAVKHTLCKICNTLLVEGSTCTSVVENKSKNGRKPWADVMVISCTTCGGVKRFPLQAPRQARRLARGTEAAQEASANPGAASKETPQEQEVSERQLPLDAGDHQKPPE